MAASVPLAPTVNVALSARAIHLSDLTYSKTDAELVLAEIPAGQDSIVLTVADQARLISNHMPGYAPRLRYGQAVRFNGPRTLGNNYRQARNCFVTRSGITAGSYISQNDVRSAPCDVGGARANVAYDKAAGAPYAAADLPAFSYLGAFALPEAKLVRTGTAMTLRTIAGPVTVDRAVTSLQPGKPGKRVFVRTKDGKIFSQYLDDPKSGEVK